jgi:rhamnosyltransferase
VRREYAASFPDAPETPPWITVSLPMAAIRRDAWEAHPFYTDAWGSEDTEWGHWAKTHGWGIRYLADACVMHSHNYTLRQLYGRRFIEGEADAFIYADEGGHRSALAKTAVRALTRALSGTVRDALADLRYGRLVEAARAPLRHATAQWGYARGRRHGDARRRRGDPDASHGQRVVLARHESNERGKEWKS